MLVRVSLKAVSSIIEPLFRDSRNGQRKRVDVAAVDALAIEPVRVFARRNMDDLFVTVELAPLNADGDRRVDNQGVDDIARLVLRDRANFRTRELARSRGRAHVIPRMNDEP